MNLCSPLDVASCFLREVRMLYIDLCCVVVHCCVVAVYDVVASVALCVTIFQNGPCVCVVNCCLLVVNVGVHHLRYYT